MKDGGVLLVRPGCCRGAFHSVRQLQSAIHAHIDARYADPKPFHLDQGRRPDHRESAPRAHRPPNDEPNMSQCASVDDDAR